MIAEDDRPMGAPVLPERGETLGGGRPESLPAEFAEHFHEPPDPRYDGRYVRPQ